jgi:hypothetical protein
MPLQYLGVGFSRTGTQTLCEAMNELGFVAKHWEPQLLSDVVLGENNTPTFKIYDDCDCMTDLPHAYFYQEIGTAYRGLKYILTERNEDEWYRSLCEHYDKDLAAHDVTLAKKVSLELAVIVYGIKMEDFRNRPFLAKKRFRDWNATIKATIPSKDLLVLNVCDERPDGTKDGYDKLCPFVGKRVLNRPFPHKR